VAELADALASGASGRKVVEVRVLSWAPFLESQFALNGCYPAPRLDWVTGSGNFATGRGIRHLSPGAGRSSGAFSGTALLGSRIFVAIDVYNGGQDEATIAMRSPDEREQIITLHAGELRRIRTGWTETSSRVEFEFRNAAPLHFDNLVYAQP
jgi:hypothetical protein